MTEIYLDSYHLHSLTTTGLPTTVRQPVDGLESPDVRIDAYDNPGDDGQTVANTLYGQRLITLQGRISGADVATYRANRQAFITATSNQKDANGRPVFRLLKFTDDDGTVYHISVTTKLLQMADTYPTTTDWQLQLLATSSVVETDTEASLILSLPVSGGIVYPVVYPVVYGAASGGSGTATNAGTAAAYPTITLLGPLTNPVVSNETTGGRIALSLSMVSSDVVVIDMKARTIIQGGATNRMGSLQTGSTFWPLSPGVNLLRFTNDASNTGTATVEWHSAFTGI